MLQATVENFRGIEKAEIDIAKIALITGNNGVGKTSIARAVAACATGNGVPFDKLAKKDCKIVLHHGKKDAVATLWNKEGGTTVSWPKADVTSDGRPPVASAIATGLVNLLSLKEKDALNYLITLLKADINEKDFTDALAEAGITKETIQAVWKTIDGQGWDTAVTRAKEKGSHLKGAWQQITGEAFGSDKIKKWLPLEWDDSLTPETDLVALINDMAGTQTELERLLGLKAISQAEIVNLKMLAESIPALEIQKKETETSISATETELKSVEDKLRNTPNPSARIEYSCPHCEEKIHIKAISGTEYILSKAEKIDANKLEESSLENAALCGMQQNVNRRLSELRRKLQEISIDLKNSTIAKGKMDEFAQKAETVTADEIMMAREVVRVAEVRVSAFKKYQEATKTAGNIAVNQEIIDFLSETGLRRKKLSECIMVFNSNYMHPLCEAFGIKSILMDADLNIQIGKTPFQMLSASEQFRVQVIIQLAIAQIEKASLVIIDNADILDQPSRKGLLQAVMKADLPTIICMTLNNPGQAPDLAKSGLGATYWVDKKTCSPMSAPAQKEAA